MEVLGALIEHPGAAVLCQGKRGPVHKWALGFAVRKHRRLEPRCGQESVDLLDGNGVDLLKLEQCLTLRGEVDRDVGAVIVEVRQGEQDVVAGALK